MVSISVIVPVYNDEEHLSRCLNSVLSQTFTNFECILIDDGSTDNSPKICDEYVQKDPRIRVIHKKNEGVSIARQLGITVAKGEYSIHLDSDDWIDPVMFEYIITKADSDGSDLLFMDFFEENPYGKESYKNQNPVCLEAEVVLRLILKEHMFSFIWSVLIRQNLYENFEISFPGGINYGEDSMVIIELLLNNPKISYLSGAYYHHSFNRNSLTRRNIKEKYYERIKFLKNLKYIFQKYNRIDFDNNSVNFFPLNAKYEMLSDGILSRNEYQDILQIKNNVSYLKNSGLRKYILLILAETKFYFIAKFFAQLIRKIKHFIK
jgi:glycosyltransferase involved in cell wall biosynthesis